MRKTRYGMTTAAVAAPIAAPKSFVYFDIINVYYYHLHLHLHFHYYCYYLVVDTHHTFLNTLHVTVIIVISFHER